MIEWMILAAALLGAASAIATLWIVADAAWQIVKRHSERDFPRARVHRIKDCAVNRGYDRIDDRSVGHRRVRSELRARRVRAAG